jgi:hypothetical protein
MPNSLLVTERNQQSLHCPGIKLQKEKVASLTNSYSVLHLCDLSPRDGNRWMVRDGEKVAHFIFLPVQTIPVQIPSKSRVLESWGHHSMLNTEIVQLRLLFIDSSKQERYYTCACTRVRVCVWLLGSKPRASHATGKNSITELYPSPRTAFNIIFIDHSSSKTQ